MPSLPPNMATNNEPRCAHWNLRIVDSIFDDDEVVALVLDFSSVNVVFSWSISRRALSAAAAESACAAAS